MKLTDNRVWIELLADTPTGRRYKGLFSTPERILAPALVPLELRRRTLRELNEAVSDRVMAATRNSHIVPLDESAALSAAALKRPHQMAAMDALVYATARQHRTALVTCDAHVASLPGAEFQAKVAT